MLGELGFRGGVLASGLGVVGSEFGGEILEEGEFNGGLTGEGGGLLAFLRLALATLPAGLSTALPPMSVDMAHHFESSPLNVMIMYALF